MSLAVVEPDPVPVEDVIVAAVAEDTSAPPGIETVFGSSSTRFNRREETFESEVLE